VGLKNDLNQIPDLLPAFDFAVNEQCFQYNECSLLVPFIQANKPVFEVEYNRNPSQFCPRPEACGSARFAPILGSTAPNGLRAESAR